MLVADRCPGVMSLHAAADGRLARVRVPGGRLRAAQLRGLATAARLGNGIVDLTARANVQVRGISDGAAVAKVLAAAGLLPSIAHDRARNIVAPPSGEFDAVVDALDAAICADPALAELGGRFLFAVGMEHPAADVTLLPAADGLAIGDAVAAAVGGAKRVKFRPTVGHGLTSFTAVTAIAPLGRLDAEMLDALAALAPEIRIGIDRTITVRDVQPAALEAIGLVTDPDSGWVGLTACAGLGACAKAERDVRAIAARRAAERGPGAPPEHYAACARGCGG
jgi:precorrin-3B synthase